MNSLEAAIAKGKASASGARRHGRPRPIRPPAPGAPARRLQAGSGAVAPHVSAVAAGFAEDQEPSPITSAALAQPRSIQRIIKHMNRIIVQFLNRAKWPWYTKPLINLAS
jgi:hypothetical protein